jgi:hypothetical protein
MAKNVSLLGADYPDVPAVQLPQTGGGTATFYDIQVIDNLTSTSSTDALSAKQGKVLNDHISKLDSITVPRARTDIKTQVDNTWFTFPSSGYFLVTAKSTGNVNIQLNDTYIGGTAPANGYFCLFVFKGMNARIINMTNVDGVYFTAI